MINVKHILLLTALIIPLPMHAAEQKESEPHIDLWYAAREPELMEKVIAQAKTRTEEDCRQRLDDLLFIAARRGTGSVTDLLLAHHADIDKCEMQIRTTQGSPWPIVWPTPLAVAVDHKNKGPIEKLIESGASFTTRDGTVYDFTNDAEIIEFLNDQRLNRYTNDKCNIVRFLLGACPMFSTDLIGVMAGYAAQDPLHPTYRGTEQEIALQKKTLEKIPLPAEQRLSAPTVYIPSNEVLQLLAAWRRKEPKLKTE